MADPRVEQIFAATHRLPPDERRAEVARLCAGDAALEARCLRLLEAADFASRLGVLEQGPAELLATMTMGGDALHRQVAPMPGTRLPEAIGPYRILSVLGEGGFGVVYAAERREPIRQRVALKLIKPGRIPGPSSPASSRSVRPWR